jgi:lectin-like protein
MRWAAIGLAVAATGCLRDTEFKCTQDSDCDAMGHCEAVGFCSVVDGQCATGRRFSESAGQGLASTCVSATVGNAGRCPMDYVAVGSSGHRYRRLGTVSWDQARAMCEQASAATYLLIPDDATELAGLATIASPPFWIGVDDLAAQGTFMTVKNVRATFTPWATGEPSARSGADCVRAISAMEIATDLCSSRRAAICECEP